MRSRKCRIRGSGVRAKSSSSSPPAAICGSDLHVYKGRTATAPRFVVSHELPLDQAPKAYEKVDKRVERHTSVVLHPGS